MGVIKESRASITGAYINPNSMGKKQKRPTTTVVGIL